MDELISRKWLMECVDEGWIKFDTEKDKNTYIHLVRDIAQSAQPDNQVHLCDSCKYTYPECPSGKDDVIYGNGKGDDNICACNKYEPSAQPEIIRCRNCKFASGDSRICMKFGHSPIGELDFCAWAERRTDE